MNPYGFVVTENNNGLMTVNGHSYANKKSQNTNFAILVSKQFTEPFHEPIEYGKYIASLANMLGGGRSYSVWATFATDAVRRRNASGEALSSRQCYLLHREIYLWSCHIAS